MRAIFICAAMTVALAAPAAATDVQVIAHPGVSVAELSVADLKEIFLGSKTEVGGGAVQPVFEQSGTAHDEFLKTYLGKSDAALRTHFKTLVFTGKGSQPKAFATDAEVLKFVASTKGAIGYVSGSADTAGAKKIQVK
jgi:ABC-type phosphate transport system substrate-binding protein